jgi:hypothetical protein
MMHGLLAKNFWVENESRDCSKVSIYYTDLDDIFILYIILYYKSKIHV